MVGEQGPELVRLPRGADVFTAAETRSMMSGDLNVRVYDGDGSLARGGYSQAGLEHAVTAAVERLASGMAHRSIRTAEGL